MCLSTTRRRRRSRSRSLTRSSTLTSMGKHNLAPAQLPLVRFLPCLSFTPYISCLRRYSTRSLYIHTDATALAGAHSC